jgi:molybdopterin converting factor small subunit
MSIHVEFYGIARQRAGVARTELPCTESTSLTAILATLGERFPPLEGECLQQGTLCQGFICNIDGNRFVHDLNTPLAAGSTLLILSADAGG